MNPKISYLKIDVSCEACDNFHHISQNARPVSPGNGIRKKKQHHMSEKCRACHANDDGGLQSLRLPRKMQVIVSKPWQSIAPYCACHTENYVRHVMKHVAMSQSAMPAIRNDVAQLLKPSKVTTFAALSKGTAIATSRGRLRTVADGCATSSEHTLKPQTPEWNGNPCYAFGKNGDFSTDLSGM